MTTEHVALALPFMFHSPSVRQPPDKMLPTRHTAKFPYPNTISSRIHRADFHTGPWQWLGSGIRTWNWWFPRCPTRCNHIWALDNRENVEVPAHTNNQTSWMHHICSLTGCGEMLGAAPNAKLRLFMRATGREKREEPKSYQKQSWPQANIRLCSEWVVN